MYNFVLDKDVNLLKNYLYNPDLHNDLIVDHLTTTFSFTEIDLLVKLVTNESLFENELWQNIAEEVDYVVNSDNMNYFKCANHALSSALRVIQLIDNLDYSYENSEVICEFLDIVLDYVICYLKDLLCIVETGDFKSVINEILNEKIYMLYMINNYSINNLLTIM